MRINPPFSSLIHVGLLFFFLRKRSKFFKSEPVFGRILSSREANRKSQNLLVSVKIAEKWRCSVHLMGNEYIFYMAIFASCLTEGSHKITS